MTRVEIIFESKKKADIFITWFCECGEQVYWQDYDDQKELIAQAFEYDFNHLRVIERNTEQE